MKTKYCIIQKGLFGTFVANCGFLYDDIEDAIIKCMHMNEGIKEKPFIIGKVEYEEI